jgi:two-component system chemotaxis response regulator CheB
VLSGLHDDGSAGLYAIKQRGGIAIVQDPNDAAFDQMPRRALEYSSPHYILPASEIAPNLIKLVHADRDETVMPNKNPHHGNSHKDSHPTSGSLSSGNPEQNLKTSYFDEGEGTPSVFACPECHGVLWELKDESLTRFRCRVGHSYSTDSLGEELSEASENALWAAMRAIEEKAALQRRIADNLGGDKLIAGRLRDQSSADDANARVIRDMIFHRDAALEAEETKSSEQA